MEMIRVTRPRGDAAFGSRTSLFDRAARDCRVCYVAITGITGAHTDIDGEGISLLTRFATMMATSARVRAFPRFSVGATILRSGEIAADRVRCDGGDSKLTLAT